MRVNALVVDLALLARAPGTSSTALTAALPGLGVVVCTGALERRAAGARAAGRRRRLGHQARAPRGGARARGGRGPPAQAGLRPRGDRTARGRRARDPGRPVPGLRRAAPAWTSRGASSRCCSCSRRPRARCSSARRSTSRCGATRWPTATAPWTCSSARCARSSRRPRRTGATSTRTSASATASSPSGPAGDDGDSRSSRPSDALRSRSTCMPRAAGDELALLDEGVALPVDSASPRGRRGRLAPRSAASGRVLRKPAGQQAATAARAQRARPRADRPRRASARRRRLPATAGARRRARPRPRARSGRPAPARARRAARPSPCRPVSDWAFTCATRALRRARAAAPRAPSVAANAARSGWAITTPNPRVAQLAGGGVEVGP